MTPIEKRVFLITFCGACLSSMVIFGISLNRHKDRGISPLSDSRAMALEDIYQATTMLMLSGRGVPADLSALDGTEIRRPDQSLTIFDSKKLQANLAGESLHYTPQFMQLDSSTKPHERIIAYVESKDDSDWMILTADHEIFRRSRHEVETVIAAQERKSRSAAKR